MQYENIRHIKYTLYKMKICLLLNKSKILKNVMPKDNVYC